MNARDAQQLIATVHRLWPTVPFQAEADTEMVRAWQTVLADIPLEAAEAFAAVRARAGDTFPPPPGVIARTVIDTLAKLSGNAVPDADEAWQEVRLAIGRHGYHNGPPHWSNQAVAAAVASIGWRELCLGDEMIARAHFLKTYPTIAARTDNERVMAQTFAALGYEAGTQIGAGTIRQLPTASDP